MGSASQGLVGCEVRAPKADRIRVTPLIPIPRQMGHGAWSPMVGAAGQRRDIWKEPGTGS